MNQILDETQGDYYVNLREFNDGSVEAVVKTIRPLKSDLIRGSCDGLSYAAGCREIGESSSVSSYKNVKTESGEISDFDKAANHSRSVRRAKQNIRWLTKSMKADRLFTLTYRRNEVERDQVKTDFKRFLRYVTKGWKGQPGIKDWQYVAVLERQDRGAFHIHCAVIGWQRISFLRAAWFKALGGQGNETGEGTPGNVDVTNPDKKRWVIPGVNGKAASWPAT